MVNERSRAVVAVVEDDPSCRKALGRLLRAEGYDAALFESAEAYMAAALPREPLCLIVDIQLPGLSGMELQKRLRGGGSSVPVILITGIQEAGFHDRAIESGCAAFFRKPFASDPLLATIATLVAGWPC